MSLPCCKIEVYDTSDALDQTITTDIIECHTKDILTTGIGTFSFVLPATKGFTQVYDDIGNNYKVKIYFGYNSSYTHLFTGKILPQTTSLDAPIGRTFEGKGLGEILERRFKRDKRWQNVQADDIAAEIASNLSLTSDLATDTTAETITINTESYFDLAKKISDYWYDGSTRVTKDFGVNKDNVFFWKARPLRTSGVETFTAGTNILKYTLKYDIQNVKNHITVYGAAAAPYPSDRDYFTDSTTGWDAEGGTITTETGGIGVKEGTYRLHVADSSQTNASFTFPKRIYLRNINTLNFWYNHVTYNPNVRLLAPDTSNYFIAYLDPTSSTWFFFSEALGETNEYDADERPAAAWHKVGSPNWYDIEGIKFSSEYTTGSFTFDFDKLWFYPERWTATAQDATSQTAYGLREAEFTDDKLLSYDECSRRANTLLYQLKDRVLRLDMPVPGNTNVLIGDRLTLTLPPDNITGGSFDVVSVENHYTQTPLAYQTVIHALDTANTRYMPSRTPLDSISRQLTNIREVTSEIYNRVIR